MTFKLATKIALPFIKKIMSFVQALQLLLNIVAVELKGKPLVGRYLLIVC